MSMSHDSYDTPSIRLAIFILSILALPLSAYVAYDNHAVRRELGSLGEENLRLQTELADSKIENLGLSRLTKEQEFIIQSFTGQIENISSTIGVLEKLSKTDPELLKKYSKVYFLNENYIPSELVEIGEDYVFEESSGNFLFHAEAWPFLKRLLDDARSNGVELLVLSAYRSFGTQASLKSEYKVLYGAGTANQFSADQGYSEHQLGTSLDLTTPGLGASLSKFSSNEAFEWLKDNAHKYGFVLSYPEGNAYYKFEPWHWRFVGVDLARHLEGEGKYFYDLDQREIDTYLVKLFEP